MRYALARGDAAFVWLLNNDTVVRPEALSALVARLRERRDAGQCGSRILAYTTPERVQYRGGAAYGRWWGRIRPIGAAEPGDAPADVASVERAMDYVAGSSLMVTREFIEAVGLMDERYFLYYEELDWATRGRRFALAYAHDSVVYHREGRSVGARSTGEPLSELAEYHGLRNRLAYTRRFFPAALPTVYLGMVAALLNRVRRGQLRRATLLARILLGRPHEPAAPTGHGGRSAARPSAGGA
jgi:GT2 family glycosyltransferase